jgi:2-polyprenyl-3-methyl-5-hydroxy-6-metoxy-1,4-benzoquinol methylase
MVSLPFSCLFRGFQCRQIEINYIIETASNVRGRILDFGCGDGYITSRLKDLDLEVVGCDINPSLVGKNKKRYPDVDFQVANDFFFKSCGKFDVIVMSHVLEHVPRPQMLISQLSQILSPGGQIIIAVPQERIRGDSCLNYLLANLIQGKLTNPHRRKYDLKSLASIMEFFGFTIKSSNYINFRPPYFEDTRKFTTWSLLTIWRDNN